MKIKIKEYLKICCWCFCCCCDDDNNDDGYQKITTPTIYKIHNSKLRLTI